MALSNRSNPLINSRRLAILLASTALVASPAAATTYNVGDEASLIAAINAANSFAGSDTIVLLGDITLTGALPTITDITTLDAATFALSIPSGSLTFSAGGSLVAANGSQITGSGSGNVIAFTGGVSTLNLASGSTVSGDVSASGTGSINATVAGTLSGTLTGSNNTDTLAINGGTIGGATLGNGSDIVTFTGGTIAGVINGGGGSFGGDRFTATLGAGNSASIDVTNLRSFGGYALTSGTLTLSGAGQTQADWAVTSGASVNLTGALHGYNWALNVNGNNNGSAVNIASTGSIDGYIGVWFNGGPTNSLTNAGSISTTQVAVTTNGKTTVNNSGTIASSTNDGISTGFNVASVANTGSISGSTSGIAARYSAIAVNNQSGGLIAGSTVGFLGGTAGYGGLDTITNANGAGITGATAISTAGNAGLALTNSGQVIGSTTAINTAGSGAVTITNTGTGVIATGTLASAGATYVAGAGTAINVANGGTITNAGTIAGTTAINFAGAGSITNQSGGMISGATNVGGSGTVNLIFANGSTAGDVALSGNGRRNVSVDGTIGALDASAATGAVNVALGSTATLGSLTLTAGNDFLSTAGATVTGAIDGGAGTDTLAYVVATGQSQTLDLGSALGGTTNFELLGKIGGGTLTLTGTLTPGVQGIMAGDGGNNDGLLIFDGTSGLTTGITVNGAIIRANTAGAFGTGTITTIDPTIQYGATGTYANDILLSVPAPASADPTRLEAINASVATLTGAITSDPAAGANQYITIGGNGTIVLTNTGNSWGGTTTVDAGATLQGASGTISGGSIVDNGTLTFVQPASGTVARNISGSGVVNVSGLGTGNALTFSATNSVAGGINVVDGSTIVLSGLNNGAHNVTLSGPNAALAVTSAGALTSSGPNAVLVSGAGDTVTNNGSISGVVGVSVTGSGFTLNNAAGATISGTTQAFQSTGTGTGTATINNSGDITGGVTSTGNGNLSITNTANGNIVRALNGTAISVSNGGALTLNNAGDVVGAFGAVIGRNANDSITNSGRIASGTISGNTITRGGSIAVDLGGGTLTNLAGGQIIGFGAGVIAGGPATIINAGDISSSNGQFNNGVSLTGTGASLVNQIGGTITGGRGVAFTRSATITNAGTITSNCTTASFQCAAVIMFAGGTFTNAATGVVVANGRGVAGQGSATTIVNNGSITSTIANDVAVILFAGGSITNNASGSIANAPGYGAYVFSTAASITNAGSITGTYAAAIDSTSGTINNSGTIAGTDTGVAGYNATLGLTNSGAITGGTYGVFGNTGTTNVTNLAGGTISSTNGEGVHTNGGPLTVDIQSGASISAGSHAIRSGSTATVTNAGTLSSTNADAVWSGGALNLTNSGTITGGYAGISATTGGTIVNSGTINGSANASGYSYAVQFTGAGSITNQSGGMLGGADGAIALFGTGAISIDLQSGSTANGAIVSTGDGARSLTVNGTLTGNYSSAGAGIDTLTLGQAGSMAGASFGAGDDLFTTFGGTIGGTLDGGNGNDRFAADFGYGVSGALALDGLAAFESIEKTGLGALTLTGTSASPDATIFAGNGYDDDGLLIFDGTSGLTGDIYVNGAIIRANSAGAFGTGTIHTIDPTVQYAATGTYANNILLAVAGDASLDPTRLEALNASTATLTGSITQDPMVGDQYVTIGGDGRIVLTNTANLWAGTTTIDSGASLQGASDTISGGSIVDNGMLAYVQPATGTVAQDISGSGIVSISGLAAGEALTFSGTNTVANGFHVIDGSAIVLTGNNTAIRNVFLDAPGAAVTVTSTGSLVSTGSESIVGGSSGNIVNNQGSITGAQYIGVALYGGGTLINGSATNANALIEGGNTGSYSGGATVTVDNFGTIRGTNYDGIGAGNLTVTNHAGGRIIGQGDATNSYSFGIVASGAVDLDNAGQIVGRFVGTRSTGAIDLINSGLIGSGYLSGTTFSYSDGNDGVQALNGGTISNLAGGQILGSISGIYATGAALGVTNAGTITGASANGNGGFGIYANGAGLTLNNLAGGTVSGVNNGIADLTGNGLAITNAGAISGDTAIFNQTNGATINNNAGGQIAGGTNGIVSGAALTLTNAGTIIGSNGFAVRAGGALTLNNSNIIDGGNSGLFLAAGGTVINSGLIIGRGVSGANQDGISAMGALNLTNSGSISAGVNAGVVAFDSLLTVNNQAGGTITGGNNIYGFAINAKAGLDLTNGGTLNVGSGTTTAVLIDGTSTINLLVGSITNGNIVSTGSTTSALTVAGLLNGRYDATTGTALDSIILASNGSLGGAVLGAGNDSFTTRGGAINGAVSGGAGSDALAFDIAGTTTYNAGLFDTFEARSKTGVGTLTLTGTDMMTADFAVNGGTLVLSGGLALNDGAALVTAAGTTTRLANANEQVRTISGAGAIDLGVYGLILGGNDTTTYSGVIGGSGSVAKFGTGVLTLSGANTYTGLSQVSGGTLRLGVNNVIANASIVAVASGATFDLAGFSDTIGGLTGAGTVALGAGRLTIDQATSTVFSGPIIGTGGVTKLGSGLLNLTGVSTYTGTTLVNGGTLAVNGSLASAVTVNAGGTLAGSGSVSGLTVNSGGILSPGGTVPVIVSTGTHAQIMLPSIYSTISVNGPLTFNAGSFYDVDIDPTQSDRTIVNGTTTLNGGTVRVNGANGTYNPLTIYTIVQSSGGVSGQFAGVTDNLAFLDTNLTYTTNQVNLEARRNNIIFSAVAANPNQANVADAVQSIRSGRLYDSVLVQTADGARQAYDALSGEVYASTQTAIFGNRDRLQDAMASNRLRSDGMALWIDAGRSWGTYDQSISRGYAIASSDTNDLLGGFNWTRGALGVTVAGGRVIDKLEIDERDSKAKTKSWLFGGQVAYGAELGLHAVAGGNYASHKVSTDRSIVYPGFAETASSSRKGDGYHLFAQVGFASQMSGITLEPFVGLTRDRLKLDALSETGGLAALDVRSASRSLTSAQVGLKLSAPAKFGWGTLTPRTSIAWQHVMGDRNGQMEAGFQAGGLDYSITGAALARDAAKVGLDLALDFGGATVIAGYNGTIGGDASQHTAKLAFQLHF